MEIFAMWMTAMQQIMRYGTLAPEPTSWRVNTRLQDTCPKCAATFVKPLYNPVVDKIWMQCTCGYGYWVIPIDQRPENQKDAK
jgi:hypothetical protein